ncbi:hypothetical protein KGM_207631 [Danaus plexippus plexippus]|uniref:Uncharacterized protein n=1 Tax=Danaus plexippus plexippus TaxID=278856 RepID=A0A212FNM6_DANPL|nr:hypothetical protein KGM_207631 [Danaus plexippus plexippus]
MCAWIDVPGFVPRRYQRTNRNRRGAAMPRL